MFWLFHQLINRQYPSIFAIARQRFVIEMRLQVLTFLFGLLYTLIAREALDAADNSPPSSSTFLLPHRFFVVTVIDLSNNEIVRDALTLFRSIRLFGGSFNNATFVAYLTGDDAYCDWKHNYLLQELSDLGIKYDFTDSVRAPLPKTLNKFYAFFKFDSSVYDYFVWLDADVVVLSDPMPRLKAHRSPGQIQCVPDPYNYLENVPNLNSSKLFWNHKMGELFLDGNRDFYPSGICNTGILIFDRLSLPRFVAEIDGTFNDIFNLTTKKTDRFLDSAVFTSIVNKLEIEIEYKSYELNFLSFLEIEIRDAVGNDMDLVFVHMIATSSFYCFRDSDSKCRCTYENPLTPDDSIIREKLFKILMDPAVCPVLLGERPPPAFVRHIPEKSVHARALIDDDGSKTHYDGVRFDATIARSERVSVRAPCVIPWPPAGVVCLHGEEKVNLPLRIHCFPDEREVDLSNFDMLDSKVTMVADYDLNLTSWLVTADSIATYESILFSTDSLALDQVSTYFSGASLYVDLPQREYHVSSPYFNEFKQQGISPVAIMLTAKSAYATQNVSVNFSTVDERFTPHSVVRLQHSIVTGRKRLILESHLKIVPYLKRWARGAVGVVFCCDTTSGLLAVESLIKSWPGDRLIMYVTNHPAVATNMSVNWEDWRSHLESLCTARLHRYSESNGSIPLLRCFIVASGGALRYDHVHKKSKRLFSDLAIRQLDLSFIYFDTFQSHRDYLHLLNYVLHASRPGTVVFGTRYASHNSPYALSYCCYHQLSKASSAQKCLARCPTDIKLLVDSAAYTARFTPLVTFDEEASPFDDAGSNVACKAFRKWQLNSFDSGVRSTVKESAVSMSQALNLQNPTVAESNFSVSVEDCAPAWYIHVAADSVDRMWGYI
jgi:hypothetical protein